MHFSFMNVLYPKSGNSSLSLSHISGRGSTTPESFPWAVDGLMGGYGHYVTARTVWGVSKDSTKVVVDLRIL